MIFSITNPHQANESPPPVDDSCDSLAASAFFAAELDRPHQRS